MTETSERQDGNIRVLQSALEEQFQIFLEHIPAAVAMLDRNMRYLQVTRRWLTDFGISDPDIIGKSHYEVFPEIPLHWKQVHQRCLAGAKEVCQGEPFLRANGATDWVKWEVCPWRNSRGEIGGLIIFAEAIAVAEQTNELENRVQERTEKLSKPNGSLQVQQNLLRRNRQLEILSRASHELNLELEIPVVMQTLITSAMELVDAKAGTYGLMREGQMVFTEYYENGTVRPINLVFGRGIGVPGRVMETRKHYISNAPANDPHVLTQLYEEFGFYNLINRPIFNRKGELIGCFELHNKAEHRPFDENDITILEGLADSAAVALENAQMLHERKQAEEALQKSEKLYRTLARNIPNSSVALFDKDLTFTIAEITEVAAIGISKRKRKSFEGRTLWEVFPPEVCDIAEPMYRSALAGKETVSEIPYGNCIYLMHTLPVKDESGEVIAGMVMIQNITKNKQSEKERQQLISLLENSSDFIGLFSLAGDAIFVNKGGQNLVGIDSTENAKQTVIFDYLMKEDISDYMERILPVFMKNGRWDGEYRFRHFKTNMPILVHHNVFSLEDSKTGKPIAFATISRDITERKKAEEELQKNHNLLQAVTEGTSDAIFVKDLQGRYLMLNSAAANGIGKTKSEMLGKDDSEIFPPEIARSLMETDRCIMTTGKSQVVEEVVSTVPYIRTFLSTKSAWRNSLGNVIGLIGVSRDITERKQAEQEIKKLNEELEKRVRERTAQLEAANKEMEAFSYSVSHDLRAPLRSIDGFSQALLERYESHLDEKGKHYLQRVRTNTQQMSELIDDLLSLSRLTRTEMQQTQVNLSAIATAISAELQETQPERQVEWAIAENLVAKGDPRLLKIALENLLNNAWKFTSKRELPRIEFGCTLQPNSEIVYFVRDNGAGFDMAYADKLFGAFQRLHTTKEFSGTGIGLATVQRIIHRHGGRVWAEAVVEEGATFYFTL